MLIKRLKRAPLATFRLYQYIDTDYTEKKDLSPTGISTTPSAFHLHISHMPREATIKIAPAGEAALAA